MGTHTGRSSLIAGLVLLGFAGSVGAQVCMTVDEAHDTLSPQERTAALMLLAKEFELAGERVVPPGCDEAFVVSHVQFGNIITVTLAGPKGHREATAIGFEDVPAVYSQMVRSLLTGRPMTGRGIVDRTNVSEVQAAPHRRVESDSVWYARLGYGATFAGSTFGGPSVGIIGYRKELNAFAIDVSFLNFQHTSSQYSTDAGYSGGMTASSLLKLEALHFLTPLSNTSAYFGGGLSWNSTELNSGSTSWSGNGLQGELTVGYEVARASTIRMFFQADAGLPFYKLQSQTYRYSSAWPYTPATTTGHRYAPSLTLSIGVGWQRGRGK